MVIPAPTVPYRPLGLVTSLLERAGFVLAHVHENLVFARHNAFFLRMEEKAEEVTLFFNEDSEPDSRAGLYRLLAESAEAFNLVIVEGGLYRLVADEEKQTIDILFLEADA